MRCCRIMIFVFAVLFTACATCSIMFPQFRAKSTEEGELELTVYYWYHQSSKTSSGPRTVTTSRTYSYDMLCPEGKLYFTASALLAVAGTASFGTAAFLSAFWVNAHTSRMLSLSTVFMCLCSVGLLGGTLGSTLYSFIMPYCAGDRTEMKAPKDNGYKLAEGFYLICVATGGAIASTLLGYMHCCFARHRRQQKREKRAEEKKEKRAHHKKEKSAEKKEKSAEEKKEKHAHHKKEKSAEEMKQKSTEHKKEKSSEEPKERHVNPLQAVSVKQPPTPASTPSLKPMTPPPV